MKKTVFSLLSILVLALLASGFFYLRKPPKPQYKTVKVERGAIVSTVSATGTLNAMVTVQVGTQVSGTISKLYVDYNSRVRKGEPIAQIDPSLFLSAVDQARGNHLNALANANKAKVTVADAKRTLGRNRQLVAQGIVSQSDVDAAQTAYDAAVAGLGSADALVLQTKGALRQAETNLNYATIRSPVDGIVVSRNVDVGQTVAASFQTPTLFTIAQDLTKMQIETSVDESDISRIGLGQTASFTVDAYPDLPFSGTVSQIRNAPVVTQNVVTYVTVIGVSNKDLKLKPGMTANVSIQTQRKEDVLKISSAALRFRPKSDKEAKAGKGRQGGMGGAAGRRAAPAAEARAARGKGVAGANRQQLFVVGPDGAPRAVSVQTGISDSGFVELVSGNLKENDEVIVEQVSTAKKRSGMGSPMGPRF